MRVVLQRVTSAQVSVDGETVGAIGPGLLALVGIEKGDTPGIVNWIAGKTASLRIFRDEKALMNLSVAEISGSVLAVSQFTLLADCRKGRRPGFDRAAGPEEACRLYELYVQELRALGLSTETGIFAADMSVELTNSGPVTIILEKSPLD